MNIVLLAFPAIQFDTTVVAGFLGVFFASFINGVYNGWRLTQVSHTASDIKKTAENADVTAALTKEIAERKISEVQKVVETIQIEINGRIKELVEAKEKAAKAEALIEARVAQIEERTQAWLLAVVSGAEEAIICKDTSGIIVSWNPGAERIFGYTSVEAIGRPMTIIFPSALVQDPSTGDGYYPEERFILHKISQGRKIAKFLTKRRKKDGTVIEMVCQVNPVVNRDGTLLGACTILRPSDESKDVKYLKNLEIEDDGPESVGY